MCGQLQGGSSQSDAQGDSSPVPASRQQENRPHCAPKPASRQQENRPLVLPHREQLSKAGSHGKVADALENEEGSKENKKSETLENKKSETLENKKSEIRNKKSEAQRDVSAAAASPAQQGRTIVAPGNNPVSACSDSQLPPFVKILQRVMERSRESDDGSLTFTFDEMEFLAADPLFARFEPVMAADIRRILASKPPG
ncbi:MAG: hypothetical protein IJI57_15390 [Flexilinea sp.]|nr:hypothetical protein [Flexilinea sp.]